MQTTKENYVGRVSFDRFQNSVEQARERNHRYWIVDIPVHEDLFNFYKVLKNKRYNIVPCVDKNSNYIWVKDENGGDTTVPIYLELGITYPDATDFRSGSIYVEHENGITSFCVKSERIENEKFNCTNEGYHTRQSKDITKALKLATKFLAPLGHDDIQDICVPKLHSGINNLREPARDKVYSKMGIDRSVIAQEVAHMIASGYKPSTQAFASAMDLWIQEGAELKRMQDYKPRACFVWVKPSSLSYKFTDDMQITECTRMEDVPEFIRNKLAVLQIANNGDAITDVGIRVSDITYWIFA